ncbi:hypothetical protein V1511DRAFT_460624 [Dipodascopsis uninucleata]
MPELRQTKQFGQDKRDYLQHRKYKQRLDSYDDGCYEKTRIQDILGRTTTQKRSISNKIESVFYDSLRLGGLSLDGRHSKTGKQTKVSPGSSSDENTLRTCSSTKGTSTAVSRVDDYRIERHDTCAHCHQILYPSNMILQAIGNKYHPGCFQCTKCHLSLETSIFYEHEGNIYCRADYHESFSPRCHRCHCTIEGDVVNALGHTYHVDHFACEGCQVPFGSSSYHARDSHAWCHECFMKKYSSKCWKCCDTITEGSVVIKVLGKDWCSMCFSCEFRNAPYRLVMMDLSFETMESLFA